jgi:hypothetical protein
VSDEDVDPNSLLRTKKTKKESSIKEEKTHLPRPAPLRQRTPLQKLVRYPGGGRGLVWFLKESSLVLKREC